MEGAARIDANPYVARGYVVRNKRAAFANRLGCKSCKCALQFVCRTAYNHVAFSPFFYLSPDVNHENDAQSYDKLCHHFGQSNLWLEKNRGREVSPPAPLNSLV